MKSLLFLLLFFIVNLNAAYLRSIRISSSIHEVDAKKTLLDLKAYSNAKPNIKRLQEKHSFEFKVRRSGAYYITLAEPFSNRVVLQEVLDTLRLTYHDVYVTRLKTKTKEISKPKTKAITAVKVKNIVKDQNKTDFVAVPPPVPVLEVEEPIKQLEKQIIPKKEVKLKTVLVKEKKIVYREKESLFWIYFSFGLLSLLLLSIAFLIKYKRDKESYKNKNIFLQEKFNILDGEIKNKELFLSHASHELRTPMTAIMGLTHIVLENQLPKFQRENIQKIENSAQNLIHIINDILDISKMQAGEFTIEQKEFNLNDIFDYVLNIISLQVKNNNLNINLHVEKSVPSHVVGDSLRLGQILINLLANAVKFTSDGGVTLSVKEISQFQETIALEFTVSDTGIGMNEEQLQNIFKSFSQASSETSRKFGGTGLGLSISKQLIEIMGGNIRASSKEGEGTQFIFTIRFALKDSQNKRQYRLPSAKLLKKKVLIVDSVNQNVIALIQSFGYFHYTTNSIPSFEEAILGNDVDFDFIVINQNKLTKLAISKLRSLYNQTTSSPKIVILSELHSHLSENILKELPVSAYLKTPFTQQSILNLLIKLYILKHKPSKQMSPKDKLRTLKEKKILIVEDNTLNHKVIQGLLSKTGIELTFVINGKEAVDLVLNNVQFDLILMDINMPLMNGYEATKEIRKYQKYDPIQILALTADVMEKSIQEALKSGMQGYITKPIIIDIFYSKIYDSLQKNSLKKPARVTHEISNEKEYEALNIEVGLERCNNDKQFYISILHDFLAIYKDATQTLAKLCVKNKFKEAREIARDLKDVSLNIGAYDVCEKAAGFEYKCEKGASGEWKIFLSILQTSLSSLFKDISHFTKEN